MSDTLKVISPVDGSIYAERPLASWAEVDGALNAARAAQAAWKLVPSPSAPRFAPASLKLSSQ